MERVLDLLIADAVVVDGSGTQAFRGSVGVRGGRIAAIVRAGAPAPHAARTVAAAGRALAPGFVDIHTHSDLGALVDPAMPSVLRQGVTTVVVGNCGVSPWPAAGAVECAALVGGDPTKLDVAFRSFGDWLDRLDAARPSVNVAALVGHGAVRQDVMGTARRPPSSEELTAMRSAVTHAMADGALGLSTGLIYAPGMHADTDEVVALAEEVAVRGGLYASHIRGEGAHLFRAVDEAVTIGRRASLPVHVSHLKCEGRSAWGRADELLARLHATDDVTGDQYPYTAWSSVLWSLLPAWAPVAELPALLSDAATRRRLVRAVEDGEGDAFQSSVDGVGWDRIVIEATSDPRWSGMSVAAIADAQGLEPVDACFALLVEDPDTACIGHAMDEDDVRAILRDPDVMVASDGASMSPDGPLGAVPVHPRNYGTFPRAVGTYVRSGVLTLETAVRKMTSLPADRFGLRDRGRIEERAFADLVLFDAATVRDTARFGDPHAFPEGIDLVVVNGTVAWEGGEIARAGEIIRGPAGRTA